LKKVKEALGKIRGVTTKEVAPQPMKQKEALGSLLQKKTNNFKPKQRITQKSK
jgi:hypothetical protein